METRLRKVSDLTKRIYPIVKYLSALNLKYIPPEPIEEIRAELNKIESELAELADSITIELFKIKNVPNHFRRPGK